MARWLGTIGKQFAVGKKIEDFACAKDKEAIWQ